MIRKLTATTLALVALAGGVAHAEVEQRIEDVAFSFEGPFGTFDQVQLQRGLKVYTEICAACHGLKYVPIRTLADPGGPELPVEQVRAYAENFEVWDDELRDYRTAKPNDNFPPSGFEGAPDLSLMAKARAGFTGPNGLLINPLFRGPGGPEYIYSFLAGYTGEEKEEAGSVLYENLAFPNGWTSMPPPLYGDDVVYDDGHSATIEAEAEDVSAFLMWTAEPKLMGRKRAGFIGVLFLGVLTVLLYLTNKQIWAPVKRRAGRDNV